MRDEHTPEYQQALDDVHTRICNVLGVFPAKGWDLDESRTVLAALETIVRNRQTVGDVIGFPCGQAVR